MEQYIKKSALVAEIERRIEETKGMQPKFDQFWAGQISAFKGVLKILDTLEVKEVNLEKESLTWEDIRELYIIFAEVDVDIELCKTADIQAETIGYYQEVLKRFKAKRK